MDVLSPFIFLRIVIILKVAFVFSLWILLPWVPILLLHYLFYLHYASIWLVADGELIFAWDPLAAGLYSLWLWSAIPRGRHSCCSLCSLFLFWVFFRVCRIGMGWCWVGYFGCWSSELFVLYFSWVLPAIGNNTLCLHPKQCSYLETGTPVSKAIRSQMRSEVWPGIVLPGCFVTIPQTNSLLAVPCPSCFGFHSLSVEHPSFSFPALRHCGQFWMPWSQHTGWWVGGGVHI